MLTETPRTLDRTMPAVPHRHLVADAARPSLSYLLAAHDARAGVIEALLQGLPVGVVITDARRSAKMPSAALVVGFAPREA